MSGNISYGDIRNMYDVCGRFDLCPECKEKGITDWYNGCQKTYVCATICGITDGGRVMFADMNRVPDREMECGP